MYTVIIPTMWVNVDLLEKMMCIYDQSNFISEVIIIDNNPNDKAKFNFKKMRIITKNKNIYVNPAWNWGVSESNNEKIIIANDDILIQNFENIITKIDEFLKDKVVIGLKTKLLENEKKQISIIKCQKRPYGWGTFMAMNKKSYIYVPEYLKIWAGDDIQFNNNEPYIILGADIKTKMSETVKKYNLRVMAKRDSRFYRTKCNPDGSIKKL